MPGRLLTPVPITEPEPDLDRPTVLSPPPDFGLDDPTDQHSLPLELRFPGTLDASEFDIETDDRPTPVDDTSHGGDERPRRDTDPAPPPDSEESG
jgi:hypothetical protein